MMHDPDRLFRKSVTGVTPLRNQGSPVVSNKPRSAGAPPEAGAISSSGKVDLDGDLFYRSGVQKKTLRELKRGRLKIDEVLDLHGYTQTSTPAAITSFIGSCNNPDNQWVMIITGKGRNSSRSFEPPRLKRFENTLVFWLIAVHNRSMVVMAPSISCFDVNL